MLQLTLSLEELKTLFPLLKKNEDSLNSKERQILVKIERNLYENLSIDEIQRIEIEGRLGGTIVYT